MYRPLKRLALCLLIAIMLCVPAAQSLAGDKHKVVLQLSWMHQFEFAGFYAAAEMGLYEKQGLDVEIRQSTPGVVPLQECMSGRAQFGVGASEVVLARLRGEPVVALSVIFQHSASALMTLGDSNIHTPQDLKGRRVEMGRLGSDAEPFAMLLAEGVGLDSFQHVDSTFSLQNLLEDRVDAVSVYITNQPYELEKKGIEYNLIRPVWYGIDFYGDLVYTSEEYLEKNPKIVDAFVKASIEGWYYALDHPNMMIDVILNKYANPDFPKTRDQLRFEYEQTKKLVAPKLVDVGHLNPGRIRHMADIFLNLGVVSEGFSLDGFVYDPTQRRAFWDRWWVKFFGAVMLFAGIFTGFHYRCSWRFQRELEMRKDTEKRLSDSEEQLSLVLWGADLGYWDWEFRTALYLDAKARTLLGLNGEQELWTKEEIESSGTAPEAFVHISEALEWGHSVIDREWQQGDDYWIAIRGKVVDRSEDGQALRIAGIIMDVSSLKRYQSQLEQLAVTDHLTGLANRRHFFQNLEVSLEQCRREGSVISVAVIDLDRFKLVNDDHGHLVGDRVLVAFAELLRARLRPYDLVARYGGEEFVILFQDKERDHAAEIVKRILRELIEKGLGTSLSYLDISFSTGIADTTEFSSREVDSRLLMSQADQRLYSAKARGRKLVVWQ